MPSHSCAGTLVLATLLACNSLTGVDGLSVTEARSDSEVGNPPIANEDGGVSTQDGVAPPPKPSCACVDAPAEGWTGPVALMEEAGASPLCPAGMNPFGGGGRDLDLSKPGCECTCGAPTDACTTASVQFSSGGSCGSSCLTKTVGSSTCEKVTYCAASSSFLATTRDAGPCAASVTALLPPSFRSNATVCTFASASEGLCASGKVCGPSGQKTCIVKDGDEQCPAAPYTERQVIYRNVLDQRSCNACSCGTPVVTCSPPTITLYSDTNCSSSVTTMTTETCKAHYLSDPSGSAKVTTPATMLAGSCPPQGGGTTGTATGKDPITVCCLP